VVGRKAGTAKLKILFRKNPFKSRAQFYLV
jgi:hypothetical protein